MKAKDLVFEPLEYGAPQMSCNMCGKKFTHGGKIASIEIAGDADYFIPVCSERCETNFKEHPLADKYLANQVAEIKTLHHSKQF